MLLLRWHIVDPAMSIVATTDQARHQELFGRRLHDSFAWTKARSFLLMIKIRVEITSKNGKVREFKGTWIDIQDKPCLSMRDGFIKLS